MANIDASAILLSQSIIEGRAGASYSCGVNIKKDPPKPRQVPPVSHSVSAILYPVRK